MKSSTADELAGLEGSSKLWIGKDYVNFIHKDPVDVHNPFEGMSTVNVLKSFCFQIKCWLSRQEFIKYLSEKTSKEDLDQTASSDCFIRSSLIWVCTACLGLFGKDLYSKLIFTKYLSEIQNNNSKDSDYAFAGRSC